MAEGSSVDFAERSQTLSALTGIEKAGSPRLSKLKQGATWTNGTPSRTRSKPSLKFGCPSQILLLATGETVASEATTFLSQSLLNAFEGFEQTEIRSDSWSIRTWLRVVRAVGYEPVSTAFSLICISRLGSRPRSTSSNSPAALPCRQPRTERLKLSRDCPFRSSMPSRPS
jgi:hypothetical protein